MAIETAAGIGMSLIASEHFFSSMLTSPMTTKKFFAGDPEGEADTRKALSRAIWLSLATGAVLSWILKSIYPLLTVCIISGFYYWQYERALAGEI